MKEVYSFTVERPIEKEETYTKKNRKTGEETTATRIKTVNEQVKVCFIKPSRSQIEDAEFFYGQKYNEYLNAGYLSRAMVDKKFGDIGGIDSKQTAEQLKRVLLEFIEASRVVEFYGGAKDLTKEQSAQLEEAKKVVLLAQSALTDYQANIRSQYSQTAENKAEEKLIQWFILNNAYFYDKAGDKEELLPLFDGSTYKEKYSKYIDYEDDDDLDPQDQRKKEIYGKSISTLVKAVTLWYNKIAEDQQTIEAGIKEYF